MASPGQPDKYQKKFCALLIDHMKEGYTFESFGAIACVGRATLYRWLEKHPEFKRAHEEGWCHSLFFHDKMGRAGMAGKIPGFMTGPWAMRMKNMFGWRDKHEVDHKSSDGSMSQIDLSELSDEDLETMKNILSKKKNASKS